MIGEIYHHGIKGQRWGIRRYQNKDGSLTPAGKKKYGSEEEFEEIQKVKTLKKKKVSELSDAELVKRIERLKLEQVYKELNESEKRKKKAHSFISDVLTVVGRNTLTNVGTQAATHALGTIVNKAFDVHARSNSFNKADGSFDRELYERLRIVNPQKGQSDKK